MSVARRIAFLTIMSATMVTVSLFGAVSGVHAGIIPYSVIAPHEYQLPVGDAIPKDGINLLLSYNTFRDEGKAWNGESGARSLFVNVNKFAHIFKVDGLDKFGFLWEGVLGFGNLQLKNNTSETGMIDGQTGLVGWYNPIPNMSLVLEYWLYLPIGSDNLSGHSWDHSFAFMYNYHLGGFTVDGDLGYKLKGDYRDGGVHHEQGNVFFANLVLAYKFMNQVEPFFKVDYQTTESGRDKLTGRKISGESELALGIGNQFKISDRLNLALWYEKGVTGRNTTKTNAGYARFIWSF